MILGQVRIDLPIQYTKFNLAIKENLERPTWIYKCLDTAKTLEQSGLNLVSLVHQSILNLLTKVN